MTPERKRQAEEAKQKYLQERQGPDLNSQAYSRGWSDADSTPAPSEQGDEEAALKKYMQINDFESALRTRPDKGAIYTNEIIIGWIEDTFKHARRTQNAEVERLKNDVKRYSEMSLQYMSQIQELRSLLERAKVFALYLGDNKSWNVVSDAAEWLSDYEKLMGKKES